MSNKYIGNSFDECLEKEDLLAKTETYKRTRKGWNKAFELMAKNKDDSLIDEDTTHFWDEEEWKW